MEDIIDSVIMNEILNQNVIVIDDNGDDGVQFKKEFRKNEQKKRQELYESRIEKYNKRIDEIQKQNVVNNSKKKGESCQKKERTKKIQLDLKTQETGKRLELLKLIKEKKEKTQNILVQKKNDKVREKQNKDTERYLDKVYRQNRTIIEDRILIEKCLEYKRFEDDNEKLAEPESENGGEIKETQEEECLIDSDQSVRILLRNLLLLIKYIC